LKGRFLFSIPCYKWFIYYELVFRTKPTTC